MNEYLDKYLVNMYLCNWKYVGEGFEYEVVWVLGVDMGVGDFDVVFKVNWFCNDLGMDLILMGVMFVVVMEFYECEVVGDVDVEMLFWFGSVEVLVWMIEVIGYCEGFGDKLVEGFKCFGEILGYLEVFMGVKG